MCFTTEQNGKEIDVKRSKKFVGMVAVAGIAFGGFSTKAMAASATANLGVSATVTNNCTISTAALAFGSYDPVVANASSNLDGTGTVVVACTKGATATIGLGLGGNASGSTRRMGDGGTNYLTYELYQDSGRSTIWNDSAFEGTAQFHRVWSRDGKPGRSGRQL
jgi:spore coat protein U domain-containing protein, fimbrial subunit CupE1/2/3/6